MLTHTDQVATNRLSDVNYSLFPGSTLRVTTRQSRATRYNVAIFVVFKGDGKFQWLALISLNPKSPI